MKDILLNNINQDRNAISYDVNNNESNLNESMFVTSPCQTINKSSYSLNELDNIKKQSEPKKNNQFFRKLRHTLNYINRRPPYLERLIEKNGEANINQINMKNIKYFSDLFNTVIDMQWYFILILFSVSFVCSWVVFALFWFYNPQECVENMNKDSFLEALLFSIETQQTIGYGVRYISKNCKWGIIVMMIQCGFSVIQQSLMGGIVFAKLSKPKKRTETLIFSKFATIASRDGVLCLMCRIGDMRKTHVINAYARMFLIRTRQTDEGEEIPYNAQELNLCNNPKSSERLLFMPSIIEHRIDTTSPLFCLISKDPKKDDVNKRLFSYDNFEIVVILEGTVESTGQSTQARTSYLPSEILWNHVFIPLIFAPVDRSKATIDFAKFDSTLPIECLKRNRYMSIFEEIMNETPNQYIYDQKPIQNHYNTQIINEKSKNKSRLIKLKKYQVSKSIKKT